MSSCSIMYVHVQYNLNGVDLAKANAKRRRTGHSWCMNTHALKQLAATRIKQQESSP